LDRTSPGGHPESRLRHDHISPAPHVRARALVTNRIGVMTIAETDPSVGMPWHWGWQGLAVSDVVNDLTSWVSDPNVSIHETKAFVCNVVKE
jgi:formate dehydrogenase major subunit